MLTRAEMRGLFGASAQIQGSLSRLVRPLYALAASDDVSSKSSYRTLNRAWLRPLYLGARGIASHIDARRFVARLCRLEHAVSRRLPRSTYESIIVRELSGARPRGTAVPAEEILRELLRA
jgi:hypothetical protein